MRQTNTKKQQQIEWRRNKINELSVKGFSQSEIVRMLDIDKSVVSRDIIFLKEEAKNTIKNHIQDKLPYEFTKCISGLEEIIKESWIVAAQADKIGNNKDKLQSLALIKDTYSEKMNLLTNVSLLQDSIRFVEQNKDKEPLRPIDRNGTEEKGALENGVGRIFIAKSNPYIILVSTPNMPEGLMQIIEQESEEKCLYHRIKLDYRYGLEKIYSIKDIERAKQSPSFDREYDLKYLGKVGNLYS